MVSVPGEASGHTGHFFYSAPCITCISFYLASCSKMKAKIAYLLSFCVFNFFLVYQIVSK